ncbi:MAG: DNA-directed RNA polymerase subunit alpha C-terminal domain-containing protein [Isosphaeraceae bacterium]|nr:DNA-directed RNA polymerase subunit alpha C-terminal domain-containing protein [Isosphaeraceae bacterium]
MTELMTTDVRALLDRTPFDASAVADLREVLGRDPSRFSTLREAIAAMRDRQKGEISPEVHLRLGVGEVLLGHYHTSLDHLSKAGDGGMARFHTGIAYENLQRWDDAVAAFTEAAAAGYNLKASEVHRAGALRRAGRIDEAREALAKLEAAGASSAEFFYQKGSLLAAEGELFLAAAELEKAIAIDRDHSGALFELAYINDLNGHDDAALEYYGRCVKHPPVPLGALINLGILYEDRMQFREAENCYRQVLSYDPNHARANLFFKDCAASRDMYYDERIEKENQQRRVIMDIPVTDFELSVRSRNCLRKMNIRTLGDLTRTTEAALLASKNFGETSLGEIKEMMSSKNVWLGMALEGGGQSGDGRVAHLLKDPVEDLSPEDKALLAKPISELNLSVRARKCMSKLSLNTVGDLVAKSGDELLECKNFGVTSLNEVCEKLATLGLKLKNA